MNLFEELAVRRRYEGPQAIPDYIRQGLSHELRPYQDTALGDFIRYFETMRTGRAQVLFHMATGSGKTVIMAALLPYLYKQGYRNFLFFVNSRNVLEKTRANFLDPESPKYLLGQGLNIDGRPLALREVRNFQITEPDSVNIRFTTVQGLHAELTDPRESGFSDSDFDVTPVVFISDEAHHLNALTRRGLSAEEQRDLNSWEGSVNRVFGMNSENVLLEFTATCDLTVPEIAEKYAARIVVDYPLKEFRKDRYSKEIQLLQADMTPLNRALQAIVLSQYRQKLFQKHLLNIKPVVLFKSQRIAESKAFVEEFRRTLSSLDAHALQAIASATYSPVVQKAFAFFEAEGLSLDALAEELRQEFAEHRCLALNHKEIPPDAQVKVNTLESAANPYRAVFAVDMLNEGWDVLNLFDIVRLSETRDDRHGQPGKTTVREAQLIGRGARYCPFSLDNREDKYKRKFDEDVDNEMRVCEELYFHSMRSSDYILALRRALVKTGAIAESQVEVEYKLKPEFKRSHFYTEGLVFLNDRETRSRTDVTELPASVRAISMTVDAPSGATSLTAAFGEVEHERDVRLNSTAVTRLSQVRKAIVATALRREDRLRFDRLHTTFPSLKSMEDFIADKDYLGDVTLVLRTPEATPSHEQWLHAVEKLLCKVADELEGVELEYSGSRVFKPYRLHEKLTDKKCLVEEPHGDGVGVPQSSTETEELRLPLSELDWYAYTENYGTSEEKRFLRYFETVVDGLKRSYSLVRVLRNERQIVLWDFDDGRRFEPDFLLFLQKPEGNGFVQYQVFAEPKGEGWTDKDKWKEDLMLRLKEEGIVEQLADGNEYRVWGLPFYTHEPAQAARRFTDAMEAF